MDYQDLAYAELYLQRLGPFATLDGRLVAEAARHLALWMSYEDVIRVADLKTRASRFGRVKAEVGVSEDQVLGVTEFMHPRYEELCELAPAKLGAWLDRSALARRTLAPLFAKGRFVRTTSLRWFLILSALAALRPLRRLSLRFAREQDRIGAWLDDVAAAARVSPDLAGEIIACQDLIKGYGDTHARGLANFGGIARAWRAGATAAAIRRWREAALADEDGVQLGEELAKVSSAGPG
jgi:indolepyruvate ferredoxin oxidoreductase beta subunit